MYFIGIGISNIIKIYKIRNKKKVELLYYVFIKHYLILLTDELKMTLILSFHFDQTKENNKNIQNNLKPTIYSFLMLKKTVA